MATTEKRKPVFVKVDALKPGTNGHNLTVQVVSSNPVQVSAPTKPRRPPAVSLSQRRPTTPARIAECLVGDETGCILFTARNEQVNRSEIDRLTALLYSRSIGMSVGHEERRSEVIPSTSVQFQDRKEEFLNKKS